MSRRVSLPRSRPQVDGTAWAAPGSVLAGAVTLGRETGVWYNAVVRAEMDTITVGEGTNVQDGCVLHCDAGFSLTVGDGVSVGHRAVLHGCVVEDDCLIGMGSVVMNGAVIGSGSIVAAGAVVLEGTVVPPGSLAAGVPARVKRAVTEEEREAIRVNAEGYRALLALHRDAHHDADGTAGGAA
ncbi:gamma carbonic anhydrase family protein [Streptomyces sp. SM14]|uniref:gamma carbonic anhydrase family protein n=1 Tax=Streptomyces sp. SM14 TaxID=1736045 RepID=UPI000CD4D7A7|nr:gamma carbonic anhydrase family protein [Streptomyces sp. SM14]